MVINDITDFPCNATWVDELFLGVEYGKGSTNSIGPALSSIKLPSEEERDLLDYFFLPAWSPGDFLENSLMRNQGLFDIFNSSLSPLRATDEPKINETAATVSEIPDKETHA
ncbi:uncharacterized protein EV154DRAFT_481874 [Mucor mucedo]|uniref:uncharacterized protein n=1 Tax=Mucor mucedo TaxID=29922 RepID=UPI0022209143|nr:uncharacterized protein EV154DRAFT_481874 [Mucor mucedo]KAI7890746.1 hypothetical protein EV154DRAFT_481874 [Mucor mucedo]